MSDRRASLRRVRELLRKELRQIFRDPRTKRIVFVAPVLQLLLFGYAVNTDVQRAPLFVVDLDHTVESRALVDALTAGGYFRVVGRSSRSADLLRALDRGSALIGLEVPPGFASDLAAGRGARVQVLVDGTSSNTATVAQGYATRIVRQFGLQRAGAAAARAGVDLRTRAWYNPALESRVYNIPAVIGTILLMMALMLTALAVVRERELGTLEQLMVSPLTPLELMLGKTLPVAAIALVDLALITAVALLWFGIPLQGSVLALLLASVLYIIGALGAGLLISAGSNTQQEAFMLLFLFLLPAIILSGFLYPVDTMPEVFQAITLLNPVRHFLEIVRGIFLKGIGPAELAAQYAFLAATAVLAWGFATWRLSSRLRG
jgi:ABC-2 type transport system permease protein